MKKIIGIAAALVFAVAIALNIDIALNDDGKLTDITLQNVEALADEGSDGPPAIIECNRTATYPGKCWAIELYGCRWTGRINDRCC